MWNFPLHLHWGLWISWRMLYLATCQNLRPKNLMLGAGRASSWKIGCHWSNKTSTWSNYFSPEPFWPRCKQLAGELGHCFTDDIPSQPSNFRASTSGIMSVFSLTVLVCVLFACLGIFFFSIQIAGSSSFWEPFNKTIYACCIGLFLVQFLNLQ